MPVIDLPEMLIDIQERLAAMPAQWSVIAHAAGLSYQTIEGLALQRPGRCNPRFSTLCRLLDALRCLEDAQYGTTPR